MNILIHGYLLCLMSVCVVCKTPPELKEKCHSNYYTQPQCIDHPDGYGCECGPGFHWNTEMCMSTAIDSRLEFQKLTPLRYTLLLGKAFPKLVNFTILFFINVSTTEHKGTILSYRHGNKENLIRIISGQYLILELWGEVIYTNMRLSKTKWHHIAWTWSSITGDWEWLLDGISQKTGTFQIARKPVPGGGELVLGQSSRPMGGHFDTSLALLGDVAHLHMWDFVMSRQTILEDIKRSCTFMYCGNVVQWADLRSGTRGAMRMRWPSGILTYDCYTDAQAATTCDKHCSNVIGAQCNEETIENIRWIRTKAEINQSIACPGQEDFAEMNLTAATATRPCMITDQNDGLWGDPNIDPCISDELFEMKRKFSKHFHLSVEELKLLEMADKLLNFTESNDFENPIDLATVIDLLDILIKTQEITLKDVTWKTGASTYGQTILIHPTLAQTEAFAEIVANVVNSILSRRNEIAWNATRPYGFEADSLLSVMKRFADVVAKSLLYHFKDGLIRLAQAKIRVVRENIEFKIEHQWIEEFHGLKFPDKGDRGETTMKEADGYVLINRDVLKSYNHSDLETKTLVGVSTFRYLNMAWTIPNHNLTSKSKDKLEDNVNTAIVAAYLHLGDARPSKNLTSPIIIRLPYIDTFNISNPICMRLVHFRKDMRKHRVHHWHWTDVGCGLVRDEITKCLCACHVEGVFAITTDMYNVNWDKGDKRPILMNVASYIGCTVSAGLTLISFIALVYYKTSTSSANLHKNLSLSIMLAQLVFMIGIDKFDYPIVCHVFAVLLHYFMLSSFAWVMNEAFNLYIMITYSAHSHGQLSDSGSLIRYYILGWVFPIVLVGSFVGTYGNTYYGKDMCWISWDHMWLYVGPAVGFICITILVMIFLAKEHNENSYTKSEKTNRVILIHIKGLWAQLILLTCCWSFAVLSLKMEDGIVKVLYGMFNCLQGAFFIVFYMLLQEEVRAHLKQNRKKKALVLQGYEDPDEQSCEGSSVSLQSPEKDTSDTVPLEPKQTSRRVFPLTVSPRYDRSGEEMLKQRHKSKIEASSGEEASDCEMITSV